MVVDEVAREWRIVDDRRATDPWAAAEAVIPTLHDEDLMVVVDGTVMPKRTADMFGKRYDSGVKTWGQYKREAEAREGS